MAESAVMKEISEQDRFVGTWTLIELGGEGPMVERLGIDAVGILMYDAAGNMAVQIMKKGHASAGQLKSDQDFKSAFQDYVCYFGEYSIDATQHYITHHVVGSLHPRDIGRELKRRYEFSGDRLILTAEGIIADEPIDARLVWKMKA